jgi:DNA-binding CsgD family transcriptional regulator
MKNDLDFAPSSVPKSEESDRRLPTSSRRAVLSPREKEALLMFSKGMTYQGTAELLGVGRETVKTMAKRILRKLNVSCIREAIACAIREGELE